MVSSVGRYVVARESNIVRVDFNREPNPPAPETALASSLPCQPAIGAWMTGTSIPNKSSMVMARTSSPILAVG